jgi:hypothetical protein
MNRSPDRVYELLPAVYRARDAEYGHPLRALLRVVNEQVDLLEADIDRLYENWFIETCDDWVVPYIAELIGYQAVSAPAALPDEDRGRAGQRLRMLIPRREVAKTLGFRRRKGTLALLEQLAADVSHWPARAVEFYALLGWSQHVNHRRPERGRTADVRDGNALDLLDGPFERIAHTVDVRRIGSRRARGLHNIPSVGLFVWRLPSYSVTHAPAFCSKRDGPQCYTVNALGYDTMLHVRPELESDPTHIADELNVPSPIRRRALEERIGEHPLKARASAAYYGEGKSLTIWAPDWPVKGAPQPVPRNAIVPADLTDWKYRANRGEVAVDPVRGRIAFPVGHLPRRGVWVTYHYAFSADMGAGEYPRTVDQPRDAAVYIVTKDDTDGTAFATIGAALTAWRQEQHDLGAEPTAEADKAAWRTRRERLRAAVIEIQDSAVYGEPIVVSLESGESLEIRAGSRHRPIIWLPEYMTSGAEALTITGKAGSRFSLDGVIVTGRGLQVRGPDPADAQAMTDGDLCELHIRHCTLVPGWTLEGNCEPRRPNEPSIELLNTRACVLVEHSIIGTIYVVADEVRTDPLCIEIRDSIVDATSNTLVAIGAPNLPFAFAVLTIYRTTVFGAVFTHAIAAAEDSIFMSEVAVARRQIGCMRFSYVTPGSRTPRRHRCQPDGVRRVVDDTEPPLPPGEAALAKVRETTRVRPVFTSTRYGHRAYAQLGMACANEITTGAEDQSEMGAFHDLYQPQREANLRVRLDEFTPAGMEADVLFAS